MEVEEATREDALGDPILDRIAEKFEPRREQPEKDEAPEEPSEEPEEESPETEEEEPEEKPEKAADEEAEASEDAEDDTDDDPLGIQTLDELAEGLEVPLDRLFDVKVKTKIDGEEGIVTLGDAIRSYQLQGHVNKKSMDLSEQRKAFEAEAAEKKESLDKKMRDVDAALAMGSSLLQGEFQNVNWDKLREEDPIEFNAKYVEFQRRHAQLSQLSNQMQEWQKERQEQFSKQLEERKQKEWNALVNDHPEFSDEKTWLKHKAEIKEYAKERGFSDDELNGIFNHRLINVLLDAKAYNRLQKGKPDLKKKLKKAPKLLKPASKGQENAAKDEKQKELRTRLSKSGRVEDAAEYLLNRI